MLKDGLFLMAALTAPVCLAQTYVSAATGSDANPCTRTSPCRTYQRAISQTVPWSALYVLDPGEYGTATITQAMTIDGGGFGNTSMYSGAGITVNAPAGAVVQLKNLSVHGVNGSAGVLYGSGAQLLLDHVYIYGIGGSGVFAGPTGTGTADLVIRNSSIDNCSAAGILVWASIPITVQVVDTGVHFTNTGLGAYNGYITVSNSSFSSPGYDTNTTGILTYSANTTPPSIAVDGSVVSGFSYGVFAGTGTATVSRSTFTNNIEVFAPAGGSIYSFGNNSLVNNSSTGKITGIVTQQ